MLDVEIDERTLETLMKRRRGKFATELDKALDTIRQRWQRQLTTQQRNYRVTGWPPLERSYAEEKEIDYPGQRILSRTGRMMSGYVNGITVDPQVGSVTINFPGVEGSKLNTIAQSHQGRIGQPKGVPPRPFRLEPFKDIADQEIRKAVEKATK